MNCPLCVDQVLDERFSHGIEVDVCPNCKGVWLDRGELERMARPLGAKPSKSDKSSKPAKAGDGKKKSKKQKSLGSRLGDLLEEALDL